MKKLFLLLAAATFVAACSKDAEEFGEPTEPPTPEATLRLEALCEQLNSDLATLHTLIAADELPDCVVNVAPIAPDGKTIGYGFAFKQNGPVTFYLGTNAPSGNRVPQFGIYETAGIRYWSMNGKPLPTATGEPVPVLNEEGIAPRLKAESGYWHVSVDNGASWWPAGLAPDGTTELATASLVAQVTEQSDAWTVTLADRRTTLSIPKEGTLSIAIDVEEEFEFQPNEIHTVHYTVTGGGSKTVVTAEQEDSEAGIYKFNVTPTDMLTGSVAITAEVPATNKILITATDGSRTATTSVDVTLRFESSATLITILTPGTLAELLTDYDQEAITELTVVGNPNDKDIQTLDGLPNLTVLDLEGANLETIPSSAFYDNTSLTSVKLPKVLKTIEQSAFGSCDNLKSITIPDGITTFGDSAFYYCTKLNLKDITLPESVTTIGEYAFYYCRFDSRITIPQNVTSIGKYAFYNQKYYGDNYSRVTGIYCKAVVPPSAGTNVFYIKSGTQRPFLYVPVGSSEAYKAAPYWKSLTLSDYIFEKEF